MLLDIFPEELKTLCPHEYLDVCVCGTFIYKCQNFKAMQMSFSKWKDKWTAIHQTKEYYLALKWNELSSREKTWRNPKCTALSEWSQPEKVAYSMIASIWHSGKGYWDGARSLDAKQQVVGRDEKAEHRRSFRAVSMLWTLGLWTYSVWHYIDE